MDVLFDSFELFMDPDWIMKHGGLYLVLLIIFIETGVIFGFFLPGDPILFISGMIIAGANDALHPFQNEVWNLFFWMLLFIIAAISGNFLGYWFGKKFSHTIHTRKESWFFKRKYIESAHQFYQKKGGVAIVLARFLPVVRTFAPIVGGMVKMNYRVFVFYNILGAAIWVISIMSLGFILGENPWVRSNLEWVVLSIVLIVTLPVFTKMIKKK
ncbi:MAG TPA: VTT domain-containing protein [Sphingobacterium sp.]|nr:VTT domain-containing protein [Sphingobacterium sp.]